MTEGEHEEAAFERFWEMREEKGIPEHEDDWTPWWEFYWAGYSYAQSGEEGINGGSNDS